GNIGDDHDRAFPDAVFVLFYWGYSYLKNTLIRFMPDDFQFLRLCVEFWYASWRRTEHHRPYFLQRQSEHGTIKPGKHTLAAIVELDQSARLVQDDDSVADALENRIFRNRDNGKKPGGFNRPPQQDGTQSYDHRHR